MSTNRIFDWNDPKSEQCLKDRGFDFAFAAQLFAGDFFVKEDTRQEYGETRMQAVGMIDGERFMVVYTQRADVTWIISARRMHLKEWNKWHRGL